MVIKKRDVRSLVLIFGIILVLVILIYSTNVRGDVHPYQVNTSNYTLIAGKNMITFDKVMFVRELVNLNPEIQAVSYYDTGLDSTLGFVNAFGGVGKNFLIAPGRTYEVIVLSNTTLSV